MYDKNMRISNIPGFEKFDTYIICDDSTVISTGRKQGRFVTTKWIALKPKLTNNGYLMITLSKNKKRKYVSLHRLLALAFIPNPNNLPYVNHKDGDKLNNELDNLEWSTHTYNMLHAKEIGLIKSKENHPNAKLTNEQFACICLRLMDSNYSIKEIAREFNVTPNSISHINTGKTWFTEGISYPIKPSRR